jgi:Na+-driven multidrug efflux pump
LGATETCKAYSIEYATYVLLAAPFMTTSFVMNQCLRSEGSATLSMIGMGFGGILNCILDPIFIMKTGDPIFGNAFHMPFGLGMGVAGASLATAISKVVSFVILIFPYITRRSLLHLSIRNFFPSKDIIKEVVSVGSSSMFRSGLGVLAGILLNDMAGNISDSVLAGIGVTTKVMMFPFSIILGFGAGFQPVAGYNWGAKRYDRVLESYRFSAIVAIIGACIMAAGFAFFADSIIIAFAGTDPLMREIGRLSIILQCVALPVHAWVAVVNMLCAGLGNAKGAFLLATSRQGTCFLPLLIPAALLGQYAIASVQAAADIVSLVLGIPIAISMLKHIKKTQQEARND